MKLRNTYHLSAYANTISKGTFCVFPALWLAHESYPGRREIYLGFSWLFWGVIAQLTIKSKTKIIIPKIKRP